MSKKKYTVTNGNSKANICLTDRGYNKLVKRCDIVNAGLPI